MTADDIDGLADAIVDVLKEALTLRDSRIASLERRCAELESELRQRPGLKYCGPWLDGTVYGAGDCTTWSGSLWIAREPTSAKPGQPSEQSRAWTLAVKKGSDGRDAPR